MANFESLDYGFVSLIPQPCDNSSSESVEFKTDVIISFTAKEDRTPMRSTPRQVLKYTIPTSTDKMQDTTSTIYKGIRGRWAVPLWLLAANVSVFDATNEKKLYCNPELMELQVGSLVLLYKGYFDWVIVQVDSVEVDGVVVICQDDLLYSNFSMVPCRIAWLNGQPTRETNAHSSSLVLEFQVIDNFKHTPALPEITYKGGDVFLQAPLKSGDRLNKQTSKDLQVNDFEIGVVENRTTWDLSQVDINFRSVNVGVAEYIQFKKWLNRRMGKYRPYWAPSFENDITILDAPSSNKIKIRDDDFKQYDIKRKHIAIKWVNSTWQLLEVISVTTLDGESVLTLSENLSQAVSNVIMVCYLGLNRLNTDKISLRWEGNAVTSSNFNTIEISP